MMATRTAQRRNVATDDRAIRRDLDDAVSLQSWLRRRYPGAEILRELVLREVLP